MSFTIARHAHCYACMRHCTKRGKTLRRRDAKLAKRKVLRLRVRDEIAEGIALLEDERDEERAQLSELEHDAFDVCDAPVCACHERRQRAIKELLTRRRLTALA
jgi:hypothetical protein